MAAHRGHGGQPAQALGHAALVAQLAEGGQTLVEQLFGPRLIPVVKGHVTEGMDEPGVVAQSVGLAVHGLGPFVVAPGSLIVALGASDFAEVVVTESDLPRVADALGQGHRLTQPLFGLSDLAQPQRGVGQVDKRVGLLPTPVGLIEHLGGLDQVAIGLAVAAAIDLVDAVAEVAHRDAQREVGLLRDGKGGGKVLIGELNFAQPHGHHPGCVQGHALGHAAQRLGGPHQPFAPITPFAHVAAAIPEPEEKDTDPARAAQVMTRLQTPGQRGAEVVVVGLDTLHEGQSFRRVEGSPVGGGPLGEIPGVGGALGIQLAGGV